MRLNSTCFFSKKHTLCSQPGYFFNILSNQAFFKTMIRVYTKVQYSGPTMGNPALNVSYICLKVLKILEDESGIQCFNIS